MNWSKFSGLAIAIAWPEFIGKQSGSWYDTPMSWLGINKNYYYNVGHAALILVNRETGKCYHFDCGRYHAPYQCGRVRDASTDLNLTIHTQAIISVDKIDNVEEILSEIQKNKSAMGIGTLYASYCKINFEQVWSKVKEIQAKGAIPFGPFIVNGINCCRFVRTGLLAGLLSKHQRIRLRYLWFLKPMPISIVNCLSNKITVPEIKAIVDTETETTNKGHSNFTYTKDNVRDTLPSPLPPEKLPSGCQWLSGEVAGSWYLLEPIGRYYKISRYSPEGILECTGKFDLPVHNNFNEKMPFSFTYLSHCSKATIVQDNKVFEFHRIN